MCSYDGSLLAVAASYTFEQKEEGFASPANNKNSVYCVSISDTQVKPRA